MYVCMYVCMYYRPVGRVGLRGLARTFLLASKRFYTSCSYMFVIPLPFVNDPLALLPLRITAVHLASHTLCFWGSMSPGYIVCLCSHYMNLATPNLMAMALFQQSLQTISPTVTPHAVLPTVQYLLSYKCDVSWHIKCSYCVERNWMHFSMRHVATTALLLLQNSLRSNLRAFNYQRFLLVLHAYACIHAYTHQTSCYRQTHIHTSEGRSLLVLLKWKKEVS